ncbi:MAG: hypothetical protein PUD38_00170 [Firmicutes bacterium]|nr:hypothetical protein [Bacillota bacterium]
MKKGEAAKIAFGGVMAALALVIMNLVGLVPVATFVCPLLTMMILQLVLRFCGCRIGWAWYGAVAILSVLLAPDKEAAAFFVCLGYYPMLKPGLDRMKLGTAVKYLFFNAVILLMYYVLINLLGFDEIAKEFSELGMILTALMLVMGNIIFFMLDKILGRLATIEKWGRK